MLQSNEKKNTSCMTLLNHIRDTIINSGPITVAHYMTMALTHPNYGYYMKKKVFGREGDFVTAPEVSQMFGEMVGIWCVANWQLLGEPENFALIELGPGRGTLMADVLRATRHIDKFYEALTIHLVEVSPQLQEEQKKNINVPTEKIIWHQTINSLPEDVPVIIIANEFLDALPIHQYIFNGNHWAERMIGINEANETLCFVVNQQPSEVSLFLTKEYSQAKQGDIVELCPVADTIISELSQRVVNQHGVALWIDYGYIESNYKSTLQAVKSHNYHNVLEDCGEADITAHVNFKSLKNIANNSPEIYLSPIIGQGDFLEKCGINVRAQMLTQAASGQQKKDIETALSRLINNDQMGELFKVFAFASIDSFSKIGF